MDANNQTQGGKELAERIQAESRKPAPRYELPDPFADTTYRFPTAEAAKAKADKIGTTRFLYRDADGAVKQVDKVDGEWYVRNESAPPWNRQRPPTVADKPLASVQAEIDRDARRLIETRAEQRAAVGQGLDDETDRKMAEVDAFDFRRIEDRYLQESAAVKMANNARKYPAYKAYLDKAIPDYPGTAEKVYALDAAYHEKIAAKAERRHAEFVASAEPMAIGQADLDRLAAMRARDTMQARESLGLNTVESDKIFTATQTEQPEVKPIVPPDVEKQYLHVGNKFYHPESTDQVAIKDKGNKLETKFDSGAVVKSMLRIAEARGWDEIKVSGSEIFRREVWLEAAARGMRVKGHSPSEQDKARLAKRMSQIEANKIENGSTQFRGRETDKAREARARPEQLKPESPNKRMAESFAKEAPEEAVKKHPELAGAAAVMISIEKKAEADGLNAQQRAIVMARVRQNVVNSIERGHIPEVKVKEEVEVKREVTKEKGRAR